MEVIFFFLQDLFWVYFETCLCFVDLDYLYEGWNLKLYLNYFYCV